MSCPQCESDDHITSNSEFIRREIVHICTECRISWVDGDSHAVPCGPEAIDQLKARVYAMAAGRRWHEMMHGDDDRLWSRL